MILNFLAFVALAFGAKPQEIVVPPVLAPRDTVVYLQDCMNNKSCEDYKLAKLAFCESSLKPNIKVLDTNNRFSYGLFQFQKTTFTAYGQKYKVIGTDVEPPEIDNLIYDPELQLRIARYMMENKESYHWKICSAKL